MPIGKDCSARTEKKPKIHSKRALSELINCKNSVSHQSFLKFFFTKLFPLWNYNDLEGGRPSFETMQLWKLSEERLDSEKSSQKKTIWQTSKITKTFHY